MKQIFLIVVATILMTFQVFAQKANEQTIKMKGETAPGWVLNINENKKVVETVLLEELSKTGLKKFKSDKGFKAAKGEVWSVIGTDVRDVYYKVSGNKKKATVEIVAATGYSNYISREILGDEFQAISVFMNNLSEKIMEHKNQEEINNYKERIETLKKKNDGLTKDNEKLLKNIENQQKKIESNKNDVEKNQLEIEKLESELKNL